MTLLAMKDVALGFDYNPIFKHLDFTVAKGEVICIHTGVLDGGSSLLKIAAGLYSPDEGVVEFEGKNVNTFSDSERFCTVCMGFEEGGLLSIFTNYNNIAFPLLYHTNLNADEIRQRIVPLAQRLQIADLLPLEPHQLNDVQTRMMNLLRAMVFQPKLILLDEIQSGMSQSMRDGVLELVLQHQQELGYSIIMTVTAGDRTDFANRTLSIKNGRLEGPQ